MKNDIDGAVLCILMIVQFDNQQSIQCDERGAIHAARLSIPPHQGPQNLDLQVSTAYQLIEFFCITKSLFILL